MTRDPHGRRARKAIVLAIVMVLFVLAAGVSAGREGLPLGAIVEFLRAHPWVAPMAFVALYAVFVFVLLPTLPMNLAAGMLWGAGAGTVLTVAGATLGAVAAFAASRFLFGSRVRACVEQWGHGEWLAAVDASGWRMVAFLRVNPVVPFGPTNWMLGVTSIPFPAYVAATATGIAPPALLVASLGASMGGILLDAAGEAVLVDASLAGIALLGLGAVRVLMQRGGWVPRSRASASRRTSG